MALSALAAPRAVRRPREIDWRLIAGAVTALIGVVGVLVVVTTLVPEERTVVVAAHELAAGSTIGPTDLAATRVRLPEGLAAQTLPESELGTLVGRQVREPIHSQELVTRTRLSAPHATLGPGQVEVRLPPKPDAAVPDDLQPGDPVTILGTIAQGKAGSGTRVLVQRAPVVAVRRDPAAGSTATGSRPLSALAVIVSQPEAQALADARANGELTVVLAGPES